MVYTQAPSLASEGIESLLKEAKIARFCSLNPDGTIHATPVWYNYWNERIIIQTPAASRKAKNVKRNRNVTVLIDVVDPLGEVSKGVIIYGKAETRDWTEEMQSEFVSFCAKYVPSDRVEAYARGLFKLTKWMMISVEPERTASFDFAKDEAYRGAVQG